MLKFLFGLLLLMLAAAFVTRPGLEDAEAALREQILRAVANEELGGNRETPETIALIGCKLKPKVCYELLRAGISTKFEDRVLYALFSMKGYGKRATCYGAFTTFFCPGGLRDG